MKFQNPSMNFILNGSTNKRTDKPKAICSPLFQRWGHKKCLVHMPSNILIAICKISDFTRHLPVFGLVNAQVKKSDNCIGDSYPSNTLWRFC